MFVVYLHCALIDHVCLVLTSIASLLIDPLEVDIAPTKTGAFQPTKRGRSCGIIITGLCVVSLQRDKVLIQLLLCLDVQSRRLTTVFVLRENDPLVLLR